MFPNDYEVEGQLNIFNFLQTQEDEKDEHVKIDKKIRLIELFAGYGSQALAFKYLGIPIEHHFVCEFDKYACKSYSVVHGVQVDPVDIRDVKGVDLGITNTDRYTYFMTYSFP